jgi:hypothetical protein
MNEPKGDLLFEATILIPFDDTGDLAEVRASMHEGVEKMEQDLINKYPDARVYDIHRTVLNIILTNWAISAIASHQKDLDQEEQRNKALERFASQIRLQVEMAFHEAEQIIQNLKAENESLKAEREHIGTFLQQLVEATENEE